MNAAEDLLPVLQQLEAELLSPSVRKSERVAQLLADGFTEIGSSGRIFNKADIISTLRAEPPSDITASNFSAYRIALGTVLLRYLACRQSSNAVYSWRSSIWQLQNGHWRMLFHQGTPCPPPS